MKLTLFSQNLTVAHMSKLQEFFNKDLKEVKFLYINTAGNYKPYKSDWMIKGEDKWRKIFPLFQEFDLERAYRVDSNFNFKEFFNNYDYIFISGGNTFLLSYWINKTETLEILREMIISEKIVYGGESAGTVITYKDITAAEFADKPEKAPERINKGLDLLEFFVIPHWRDPEFQPALEKTKKFLDDKNIQTYEITNDQALFVNDQEVEVV